MVFIRSSHTVNKSLFASRVLAGVSACPKNPRPINYQKPAALALLSNSNISKS
jgi:hypothetical protein